MQLWLGVSNVLIQQWHNSSEKLPIPPLHKWSSREDDANDKGWTPKIGWLIGNQTSKVPIKYRMTPHATTGRTPAELMFGRNLRTRFDLIFPDT